MAVALGVDLGATNLRFAVIDSVGEALFEDRQPTPVVRDEVVPLLRQEILSVRERFPELCGVGIGVAGVVHEDTVTSNNLSWDRLPLREELGIDDLPVRVENDINAAALGEWSFGAARGTANAILLTVSTGIGAGIIMDGRLYRGSHGTAGEVGHTVVDLNGLLCGCGRRGCWEMIASGTAHVRRIREAFQNGTWPNLTSAPTPAEVTERARHGDKAAYALIRHTARYVAIGIANLVNVYNPEAIILTGGFAANNWDLIEEYVRSEVREQSLAPAVELTLGQLGDSAGVVGAASLMLRTS